MKSLKNLLALQTSAEEIEDELKAMRLSLEYPVLMDINHDRSKEGLSPVVKLTVPVLKTHLRGKSIQGMEWKMGSKKREDLIEDYRYTEHMKTAEPLTHRGN